MGRKGRRRRRTLAQAVAHAYPHIEDPEQLVRAGGVLVDGRPVTNPRSLVRIHASLALRGEPRLRGEAKLQAALAAFAVPVAGRVALDLGAAAGGFTRVLLRAGAKHVYAVDAGYGQLLGSLRQDARVVNLERVNLGRLDRTLVPQAVDVVTIDLSYLAIADAVAQLGAVTFAGDADLVGLVKPVFELGLAAPPRDPGLLAAAVQHAWRGLTAAGWRAAGEVRSPVEGARGAIELLVHARRDV